MDTPSTTLFLKKGECYSITINPDDRGQYFRNLKRLNRFINKWNEIFLTLKDVNYFFMVECSEPRKLIRSEGPRLHLHGTIRFKNNRAIKSFLVNDLSNICLNNSVDIDTINDHKKWFDYITKQKYIMQVPPLSNMLMLEELWTMYDILFCRSLKTRIIFNHHDGTVSKRPTPSEDGSADGSEKSLEGL